MKKWTKKQEENLQYCREQRKRHWAAMMAWPKEVRRWERIKVRLKGKQEAGK